MDRREASEMSVCVYVCVCVFMFTSANGMPRNSKLCGPLVPTIGPIGALIVIVSAIHWFILMHITTNIHNIAALHTSVTFFSFVFLSSPYQPDAHEVHHLIIIKIHSHLLTLTPFHKTMCDLWGAYSTAHFCM